jgi:hypothetical protein
MSTELQALRKYLNEEREKLVKEQAVIQTSLSFYFNPGVDLDERKVSNILADSYAINVKLGVIATLFNKIQDLDMLTKLNRRDEVCL